MKISPFSAMVCVLFAIAPLTAAQADERLNVVELFQSQGCSSCPPANVNVMALADRADVLALSFGVTYWDYLGWKDTFAKPAFTQRQRDYMRGLRGVNVYTPQVVINGRADVVGVDRAELDQAIRRNVRPPFEPVVGVTANRVTVGAGTGQGDVWLVRYDPRITQVPIRRGENGGRTLPHRNVVREITRIGTWSGRASVYAVPAARDAALKAAILVQRPDGGAIVAAAKL